MFTPTKIIDIEISQPLMDIEGLEGYAELKALIRLHGSPVGFITVSCIDGRCKASDIGRAILSRHGYGIMRRMVNNGLGLPMSPDGFNIEDIIRMPPVAYTGPFPLVTVAVCTRDRSADLAICLQSLVQLDYPALDVVIVDNASKTDDVELLVSTYRGQLRYVREPRPGLDWARNRAIIEARGEIIAFTDDDVVVDSGWIKALSRIFAENEDVAAVTGLVAPYEIESEAQELFEIYGGFGRGFERKWYRLDRGIGAGNSMYIGAGVFGTGANMAFRRCIFNKIGGFDPALDVGTITQGGGDLEMFFRILQEGHTLVYEPSAIVRHRHRRDYAQLRSQLFHNGTGLYAYFVRSAMFYPRKSLSIARFGLWWLYWWHFRRLAFNFIYPARFPSDLILTELRGVFLGIFYYFQSRRTATRIALAHELDEKAKDHSDLSKKGIKTPSVSNGGPDRLMKTPLKHIGPFAVRTVELCMPLQPLWDVKNYASVRVFVLRNGQPLGRVDIQNLHQPIGVARLQDAIADNFAIRLLESDDRLDGSISWSKPTAMLARHFLPTGDAPVSLRADVSVSVVLATYDRPDHLRESLKCLLAQQSLRSVEVVVVDNNPSSGLTPPIVAEFDGLVLVNEPRKGSAYARNKGIISSKGDIIITTDDDVIMPPDWLEKLVTPFAYGNVMAVTGNILPYEMKTTAECLFEIYGGLGRGFIHTEFNRDWFDSFRFHAPTTWNLGGTANAAFRATVFCHPMIGLMHEALGAGMPSGVGEDTYLFYKILKEGFTFVYEPAAYVWHKHRSDMKSLRRQIFNYSKGHVAYHLTTLLRDNDLRGLFQILLTLPKWQLSNIKKRLFRKSPYPISLILTEIWGNLLGPYALWKSHRRVREEGRSEPYFSSIQQSQ